LSNPQQSGLIESVTGVVLAGGGSTRMGVDKALLRFDDQPLVERCLDVLRRCFASNLIIASRPERFASLGVTVFPDERPGLGPIGGLHAALRHSVTQALFLVACDMPFLDAALIRKMAAVLGDLDAVVAQIDGRFEPVHAVYQRRILPAVEKRIAAGDYSLQRLIASLRIKGLSEGTVRRYAASFVNVNTPEELEQARKRYGRQNRPQG
jgi:molybdenum cofactor guanylyltransferase